jgi:hypothetical protein
MANNDRLTSDPRNFETRIVHDNSSNTAATMGLIVAAILVIGVLALLWAYWSSPSTDRTTVVAPPPVVETVPQTSPLELTPPAALETTPAEPPAAEPAPTTEATPEPTPAPGAPAPAPTTP